MCGIVGLAGNTNTKHNKMFRDMLIFDIVRGVDSTGVLSVPLIYEGSKGPKVEKKVGLPNELWDCPKSKLFSYNNHITSINRVLLGHNRAATIGVVTEDNAHPIQMGDIYGVHNGTLRDYSDLDGYEKYDIDSKCIYETINNMGIAHTWKSFTGAASLVWWDDKDQTLNFIRNKERPLFLSMNEAEDVLFWASEEWMIEQAAKRNKITLKKEENDSTYLRYFLEDHHYKYEISNTGYKFLGREKLEKKPLTTMIMNTVAGYTNGSVGFRGQTRKHRSFKYKNKSKQLHAGWAGDMEKADKDTRGVYIELTHNISSGDKFIGKFCGEHKGFIHVYPDSVEAYEQLKHAYNMGNKKFKTISRMRKKEHTKYTIWGISSRGLKPVIEAKETNFKVIEGGVKQEEETAKYLRSYKGTYVSVNKWKELLSSGPGSSCDCAYCGDPLRTEDHEDIIFLNMNDALCPKCSTSNGIMSEMYELYPGLDYNLG